MGLSLVATAADADAISNSISRTTPAGIQDDDGIYAIVYHRYRTLATVPSGWSLVQSESFLDALSEGPFYISIYEKDTVVAANSSTSYTWAVSAGDAFNFAVHYVVVRASLGAPIVAQVASVETLLVDPWLIQLKAPQLTATRNGEIFLLLVHHRYDSGSSLPTAPTGATLYSPTTGEYFAGAYQARDKNQQNNNAAFNWNGSSDHDAMVVTVRLADNGESVGVVYEDEVTDGVRSGASILANQDQEAIVVEPLYFTPVLLKSLMLEPVVLSDGVRTLDTTVKLNTRHNLTATETVNAGAAAIPQRGVTVPEGIGLRRVVGVEATYGMTLQDIIRQRDTLRVSIPVLLANTIGVSRTLSVVRGLRVLEELGIAVAVNPKTTYGQLVSDVLRMRDVLSRFVGGSVSDTIGVDDVDVPSWAFMRVVSEGVGLAPLVSPKMLFRVEATDELGLDDAQLIKSIFSGLTREGVQVSAAYVSPDGNFTAWAINTNTGAVSEYQDYVFNSFAKIGNKYLGANSGGLYELNGDDDDGADIIARIKTGLLQFGGAQLTSFKGAYLGVRGEGDFYLKMETGDGKSYTYKVTVESMKTAKIQMGKGIRARYFSFELYNVGQDFDLESIEFLPIVANRRV